MSKDGVEVLSFKLKDSLLVWLRCVLYIRVISGDVDDEYGGGYSFDVFKIISFFLRRGACLR